MGFCGPHSEQARAAIAAASRRRFADPGMRSKLRASSKRAWADPATRAKINAARDHAVSDLAQQTRRSAASKARKISRYVETDLGIEARCTKCKEFWPADPEFFYMLRGEPHSWCKACYIAARIAKGTSHRTGRGSIHDHAGTE